MRGPRPLQAGGGLLFLVAGGGRQSGTHGEVLNALSLLGSQDAKCFPAAAPRPTTGPLLTPPQGRVHDCWKELGSACTGGTINQNGVLLVRSLVLSCRDSYLQV
jgi:hypothetical protein